MQGENLTKGYRQKTTLMLSLTKTPHPKANVIKCHFTILQVPLQGFKALQGSTGAAGPRLFTLHLIEAPTDNLPKAHTCFNRLDLPPYESKEKMLDKLTQAVEETCGFAVE